MDLKLLSEDEVRDRLASYDAEGVTDELYDFGRYMITEILDRFAKLDTKATNLAAYSVGVITLLVSSANGWKNHIDKLCGIPIPIYAGAVALIAAAFSVSAIFVRNVDWFSQDEWLKPECLSDRERLRRYRLLTMWGILKEHQIACERKAKLLKLAQRSFGISGLILFLSLLSAARNF